MHISTARFLAAQSVGIICVTIGVILARRLKFLPMMLVILGTIVAGNALTHTVTALSILSYGPGLVSSIVVWGPLGIVTMIRFKRFIDDQRQYWIAIAIVLGVNVVVGILTMRGGRVI